MRNLIRQPSGKAASLAVVVLLLVPAWATAQVQAVRTVEVFPFVGYSPSVYSSYATVGPPSYLTSINYPTMYGMRTLGTQWAGASLTSMLPSPYTTYPEIYNPVNPPAAAAYSQYYYQTGPAGYPSVLPAERTSPVSLIAAGPATIDIAAPVDADIRIQNRHVTLTGTSSLRHYQTPFLRPGAIYSYDVTATWNENGHEVTRTERVLVRPGEAGAVSFLSSSSGSTPSMLEGSRELPPPLPR